jgi:peptide/nickel transport system substrate-binding protein
VPNIKKVYVQRDPAHFHYFYATNNPPVTLFFNDQKYPYSLVSFRKAISYAIDRTKVYLIGEYGYEPPSDAVGIADEWPSWVDKSLEAQAKELASYKPAKARALLAKAGFTWKGGRLYDPRGHRVSIQFSVIGGWVDWVQSLQILAKNLQAIGIDASVKLMDVSGWSDKASKGLLQAAFSPWMDGGATPYYYFKAYMSKESYVPTGQAAAAKGTNWARWWSPQAEKLLKQFSQSTDSGTQHAAIGGLQKIQLDQMPQIPVMIGATWYTYSTLHFTGWPTPSNYYSIGAPWQYPDDVKVMTSVTPVK